MEQNTNIEKLETNQNEDLVIKLKKPFTFEGEEIKSIDLSNIEKLTGAQLAKFETTTQNLGLMVPEITMPYAFLVAEAVTGKPIELFEALPAKEAVKLKRAVSSFMNT